jgi:rhodanese-related sulfurtransferase
MPITKGFRQLVDEATAQITTYSVAQVRERLADPAVQIVDIRDVRELEREGTVPGALLAPRGMLEFWVDPASPYYKPVFGDESREFILFCGAGWRSALAAKALKDMGMTNVAHIDGGFAEWVKQAAPVETLEAHKLAHAARRAPRG